MRVAIGGILHETCTYADETAGMTGATAFHCMEGQQIMDNLASASTMIAGVAAAAQQLGSFEVVPTFWAETEPSGTIARDGFEMLKGKLLTSLSAAMAAPGGLDAVLLDLHGAGVVEGGCDMEAEIGMAVRALVGHRQQPHPRPQSLLVIS